MSVPHEVAASINVSTGTPRRLWGKLFVALGYVVLLTAYVGSAGVRAEERFLSPIEAPMLGPPVSDLPLPSVTVPKSHRAHRKHFSPLGSPPSVVAAPANPPDYDPLVTSAHPPTSSSLSRPSMKKSASSPPGVGLIVLAPLQSDAGDNLSGLAHPPLAPEVSDCCGPELVLKRGSHGCHCVYPIKLDLLLSNVSQSHNWTCSFRS